MWNALQGLVSWPLAATVYPLTTRRIVLAIIVSTDTDTRQAHLNPLLLDFSFRSGFAASAYSSDSRMLVSRNLIADFSGQLAHLVFLSQR
jgi:hypothetical protein